MPHPDGAEADDGCLKRAAAVLSLITLVTRPTQVGLHHLIFSRCGFYVDGGTICSQTERKGTCGALG